MSENPMKKDRSLSVSEKNRTMNHLARFASLLAALCLGLPTAALAHDYHGYHGSWHGNYHGNYHGHGHYYGPGFGFYAPFPFYAGYPYYGGGAYYDSDDAGPSYSASIAPGSVYHGARVDDHTDALSVDVQRALRHDGYYRGEIDGDIGAGTRAAIRQYQYDHHLEVTGRIDRALLQSLNLD
jgi:hypothetical protein